MALADFLGYDFGNVIFKASWDNSAIKKLADDNTFWKDWLNKKFSMELESNNINYRKFAEKVDFILAKMKEFNISMTLRSFKYILLHKDIPIEAFFKKVKKDTFAVYGDIRELEKEYNISFEGQESEESFIKSNVTAFSFLSILSPTGKRNYKRYIDKVLTSTVYILPSGQLKTVEYNADADKYVRLHLYAQLGRDKRWDSLKDVGEAVYMRYFYY